MAASTKPIVGIHVLWTEAEAFAASEAIWKSVQKAKDDLLVVAARAEQHRRFGRESRALAVEEEGQLVYNRLVALRAAAIALSDALA